MRYLLGMDAGGTKTLCVLVDETGKVVGIGRAGCGNYQASGSKAASHELSLAINAAILEAAIEPTEIAVAYYGISGADREEDFAAIRRLLEPINPAPRMFLENDTMIALRAGTEEGVGIGLISGTGTNAIGCNRRGERLQVGGWGSPYLGDFGSAHDIAATAFRLAQRGSDGRGPPTLLYAKLLKALGVNRLIDICAWDHADTLRPLDVASFAPLVFDAALEGDEVAVRILELAGTEISLAAKVILHTLFRNNEEVSVVLGGSVFQKGAHPAMVRSLEDSIRKDFPSVRFVILDRDPVLGAILSAADRHFVGLPVTFSSNLFRTYPPLASHNTPLKQKTE